MFVDDTCAAPAAAGPVPPRLVSRAARAARVVRGVRRAGRPVARLVAVAVRWAAVEWCLVGWLAGWAWRTASTGPGVPWPGDLALTWLAGGHGHVPRLVDRVARVTAPADLRVVRGTVSVDPVPPDGPPPAPVPPAASGWVIAGWGHQPAIELWLWTVPSGAARRFVRPAVRAGRWPVELRRAWAEQRADLVRRGLW